MIPLIAWIALAAGGAALVLSKKSTSTTSSSAALPERSMDFVMPTPQEGSVLDVVVPTEQSAVLSQSLSAQADAAKMASMPAGPTPQEIAAKKAAAEHARALAAARNAAYQAQLREKRLAEAKASRDANRAALKARAAEARAAEARKRAATKAESAARKKALAAANKAIVSRAGTLSKLNAPSSMLRAMALSSGSGKAPVTHASRGSLPPDGTIISRNFTQSGPYITGVIKYVLGGKLQTYSNKMMISRQYPSANAIKQAMLGAVTSKFGALKQLGTFTMVKPSSSSSSRSSSLSDVNAALKLHADFQAGTGARIQS